MTFDGERLGHADIAVHHALNRTALASFAYGHPAIVITRSDWDQRISNVHAPSPEEREQALTTALDLRYVHAPDDFDAPVSLRWNTQFNVATTELLIHYPSGAVFIDSDLRSSQQWLDAVAQDPAGGVVVITPTGGASDPDALREAMETGKAVWVRSRWRLLDVAPTQTLQEIGATWNPKRGWAWRSNMEKEMDKTQLRQEIDAELRVVVDQARPILVREFGAKPVVKVLHNSEFPRHLFQASEYFDPVSFTAVAVQHAAIHPDLRAYEVFEQCWDKAYHG